MRINGVDPNVVESVREKIVQPVVRQMGETKKISQEYQGREQDRDQGRREEPSGGLKKALYQLNNVCQTMGNPVMFRLVEKDSKAVVEVYDGQEDRVVKEVAPEEILSVVTQVEKLLGLLIDARV